MSGPLRAELIEDENYFVIEESLYCPVCGDDFAVGDWTVGMPEVQDYGFGPVNVVVDTHAHCAVRDGHGVIFPEAEDGSA